MLYQYIKALHLIFVVTWFAGLFYIVRLFVYHVETAEKTEPERGILTNQFKIMEKRLWYGITWPSMIGTLIFGTWLAYLYGLQSWLILKLFFVAGLVVYHIYCHNIFKKLQNDQKTFSSTGLRIWNEVATIFLVSIVFIAVLKNTLSFLWGLAGLVAFALVLMAAIRIYKTFREKNNSKKNNS